MLFPVEFFLLSENGTKINVPKIRWEKDKPKKLPLTRALLLLSFYHHLPPIHLHSLKMFARTAFPALRAASARAFSTQAASTAVPPRLVATWVPLPLLPVVLLPTRPSPPPLFTLRAPRPSLVSYGTATERSYVMIKPDGTSRQIVVRLFLASNAADTSLLLSRQSSLRRNSPRSTTAISPRSPSTPAWSLTSPAEPPLSPWFGKARTSSVRDVAS